MLKNISLNIKHLRRKENFTQTDLAQKIGITRQQIANYESGIGTIPLEKIIAMSEIFNISIDSLVYSDLSVKPVDNKKKSQEGFSPSVKTPFIVEKQDICIPYKKREKALEGLNNVIRLQQKQTEALERIVTEKEKQIEDLKNNFERLIASKGELLVMKDETIKAKDESIRAKDEAMKIYLEDLKKKSARLSELEAYKKAEEAKKISTYQAMPDQGMPTKELDFPSSVNLPISSPEAKKPYK